ncbi:MAG: S49 family peptidase [Gemmataceae bacterium]
MESKPSPPRRRRIFWFIFAVSLLINVSILAWYLFLPHSGLVETRYIGEAKAKDKIAIVRVTGVISDATLAWPLHQLQQAAVDPHVKAIVLRIDSPGGTISASEELYRCIVDTRDNTGRRWTGSGAKPIVTSMGGLAASGGYYIACAGHPILAEKTTITGSIGVFVALPNAAEFAEKHGIKVELVKAGGIKASGSMFQSLSPLERQPWQDTVDAAYDQFLSVIHSERPALTADRLKSELVIDRMVAERDSKGNLGKGTVRYTRIRADGGTFTPAQALEFGLIDEVADLTTAVKRASEQAKLTNYHAFVYERSKTWSEQLLGFDLGVKQSPTIPDLSAALTPRLWYLAPNSEMAGYGTISLNPMLP